MVTSTTYSSITSKYRCITNFVLGTNPPLCSSVGGDCLGETGLESVSTYQQWCQVSTHSTSVSAQNLSNQVINISGSQTSGFATRGCWVFNRQNKSLCGYICITVVSRLYERNRRSLQVSFRCLSNSSRR